MGVEDRRAAAHGRGRGADRARHDRAHRRRGRRCVELGEQYGWPIAIKASAGGGGRGPARSCSGRARPSARSRRRMREGQAYFSDPTRVRREVRRAIRATSRSRCWPTRTATSIHLGERDCTLQRRHQKVIEESPVAGGRRGAARAHGGDGRRRPRARSATSAPARSSACSIRDGTLLLPRDEHAHPGRAHGHRDGHRRRPRARADRDRRRRAAAARARASRAARATRSSAASTPRTPAAGFLPRSGPHHALPRAGRAGRARRLRAWRRGPRLSASTTRWWRSSWSGTRIANARDRADAPRARRDGGRGRGDADPLAPR